MKRPQNEIMHLVREYEDKMSEAPAPIWMDASDILDVLDYYEQQNMYFESEQCMRLARKLHPENLEVQMRYIYRLKNEGKWIEANNLVESMEDQKNLDVEFFKGEKALSELQIEEAERHFLQGIANEKSLPVEAVYPTLGDDTNYSPLILEMAELFMDYGSVDKAKKYLRLIKPDAAEYNRAQLVMAECAYQLGDIKVALEKLEVQLDADPYFIDAWILKADLLNESKRWQECSEAADFALAIEPTNEKALRFKACAALGQNHFDEVLAIFAEYRQLYPYDYTMALSAGEILLHQRKYEEAFEVLCHSNRNCPNENADKIRILTDIAVTYSARHDMQKAYDTLLGICSLGLTYVDVLFHAANQAFDYKEIEFGKSALEHALKTFGTTPEQRLVYARMLCEHNLFGEVSDIWDTLLDVRDAQKTLAAPYLAFAARRLFKIPAYKFWLAYAIYQDPTLTNQIFRQIYPNCLPQEYLACANQEFPEG